MRIYINTSVVGGVFDEEFSDASRSFFAKVDTNEFTLVASEILRTELALAPERVRTFLDRFSKDQIEEVKDMDEALDLADLYVAEKVVGATSLADCQHINTALQCLRSERRKRS